MIRILAPALLVLAGAAPLRPQESRSVPDYERDVLPILSDYCFQCHGPDPKNRKGELRLDEEKAAKTRNADGVAAVVPGRSAQSGILQRLLSKDRDEVMPPPKFHKRPSKEQVATIRAWIDSGAPWGEHWAFRPLAKPAVPAGARSPVDAFVRARLEKEKLAPSPEADRPALLRRLTLDLTGLPPTSEELVAFLADAAPDAYERAVDRLLASLRYGERMAWDWLEVARYADSNGYQGDGERTMWPWRDWVVKAFNENMPWDRFTVLQIAGDQLPEAGLEEQLPTGFLRNHPINGEGGRIAEENRVEYVMDMAETVGTAWLGLTFNCCRCHDHKFDPLTKADYYGLFAFFNQTPVNGGGGDPQTPPFVELPTPEQNDRIARLDEEFAVACSRIAGEEESLLARPEPLVTEILEKNPKIKDVLKNAPQRRNRQQFEDLSKAFEISLPDYAQRAKALRDLSDRRGAARKSVARVMVMQDQKAPRKTYQLDKGLYDKRQEEIAAAVPAKLPVLEGGVPRNRLALARWLVRPDQPLTARVVVNRFWQQFFGIGLTKTSEDFGVQGERPVHRELLDWLAADFRDSGWDVKRLVRTIVTSATYRQSSQVPPGHAERDPHNRLLARGPRFRMPSWMIRDQALAASGLLSPRIGGAPVKPYQPAGVWEEATFGGKRYEQDHGEALYRRSLYVFWRRIVGPTMFFDTSSRSTCTVKPTRTNTPLHALATLNDPTYVEAGRVLAERILQGPGGDAGRIDALYRRVLGRSPVAAEVDVVAAGLARHRADYAARPDDARKLLAVGESKRDMSLSPAEHAAWTALALTILNLDEAVTKE
jgi:mono/diheme cytochrome c family protein